MGLGQLPELLDPALTGTLQYESATTPQTSTLITGTNTLQQNTSTYDFGYQQGFQTGTLLNVTFNNTHTTTNSQRSSYQSAVEYDLSGRRRRSIFCRGLGRGSTGGS